MSILLNHACLDDLHVRGGYCQVGEPRKATSEMSIFWITKQLARSKIHITRQLSPIVNDYQTLQIVGLATVIVLLLLREFKIESG